MNMARISTTGLATAMFVLPAAVAENQVPGADAWNARTAQLGVVHPAIRSPLQEVISLRGEWEFAVDPQARGLAAGWMLPGTVWPSQRTIQVPGCWEAQGVGEPGVSQPWDMIDGSVRLKCVRDVATAEYGTLLLALPSSKVTPGKPLRLKVAGSESGSLRWFGVFQTW